jgi:hypothetical protein
MGRLKSILAVATIMATLLAMNAGPALADDDGCIGPIGDNGKCIGVETDSSHHDWNDCDWGGCDNWNDCDWDWDGCDGDFDNLFINDFDDLDDFDWDGCDLAGVRGDEAFFACDLD